MRLFLRWICLAVVLSLSATTAHAQVPVFFTSWGGAGTGPGQFTTPVSVAAGPSGTVYTCDSNQNRIQAFSPTGTFLFQWGSTGTGAGQFTSTKTLAVDPSSGNVYVSDGNRIQKFTSNGTYLQTWVLPLGGISLAVHANGDVVAAYSNRIEKYTNAGVLITRFGTSFQWDGVAVDSQGNTFGNDRGNSFIRKFSPAGGEIAAWGGTGVADGKFSSPTQLAVDALGRVYVVDNGNHRIQMFSNTGAFLGKWGTPGSGPGQFLNPVGVGAAVGGMTYVADTNNSRIQAFGPDPVPAARTSWGAIKNLYR